MFNKKRLVVAVVFILFMFCFITFAGGTPQNQAIATRNVTFIDSYNNAELSAQRVIVGEDADVPEDPRHNGLVFVGWYLEDDRDTRVRDFTNVTDNITVIALYGADVNGNGIFDDEDQTFTVRFVDSTNNVVIATRQVLIGMSAVAPTAPTHAGMTFTGWDASYTNVRNNRTINAIYRTVPATEPDDRRVVTHTVTFIDGLDRSIIATVEVEEGLTAGVPIAPTHDGYVFVRWDGNLDEVTEEREITAVYAADENGNGIADESETKYTVNYRSLIEGTKNEAPKYDKSFLTTEEYTVLENTFVLDGHIFMGWTQDSELASAPLTEDTADLIEEGSRGTIGTENIVYYAVWAEDKNGDDIPDYRPGQKFQVTIIYGIDGEITDTITVLKGTTYADILPDKQVVDPTDEDDYVFDKWVAVEDEEEKPVRLDEEITSDITVKAIYAEDMNHNGIPDTDPNETHYDVTFKTESKYASLMGDDEASSYTVSIVEGAKIGTNVPHIVEFDDDKIAFVKWTKFDGIKDVDHTTRQVEETIVTSDMAFTAQFGKDGNDNGTPDIEEETLYLTIEYRNAVTNDEMFDHVDLELVANEDYEVVSPVPEKGNYTITPKTVAGTMTKEASGTTIIVTYKPAVDDNQNGIDDSVDTYFTVTFKDRAVTVDTQRVLIGMDAKAPEVRESYIEGGYTYTFANWDKSITNIRENMTVNSVYTETANEYKVTYIIDGEEVTTETVTYNTTLNSVPEPTKTGYTLGQWKLNGTVFDTTAAYTQTANITLTNTFTANTYTVTYIVDGKQFDTKTVAYDATLTHPTEPTKTGYTFAGWYTDDDTLVEDDEVYHTADSMTLTARYDINTYEVAVEIANGTVDKDKKTADYNTPIEFTVIADKFYTLDHAVVTCTNAQKATLSEGTLKIDEVTADSVCTIDPREDRVGGGETGEESDGKADAYQAKIDFEIREGSWQGTLLYAKSLYADKSEGTNRTKIPFETDITDDYYIYDPYNYIGSVTSTPNGDIPNQAVTYEYKDGKGYATLLLPVKTKDEYKVILAVRRKQYNISIYRTFDGVKSEQVDKTLAAFAGKESNLWLNNTRYDVEGYTFDRIDKVVTCEKDTEIKIAENGYAYFKATQNDVCYINYIDSEKNPEIADSYKVHVNLKVNNSVGPYDETLTVKGGQPATFDDVEPLRKYKLNTFTVDTKPDDSNITYKKINGKDAYQVTTKFNTTGAPVTMDFVITLKTTAKKVTFVTEDEYTHLLKEQSVLVDKNSSLSAEGITSLIVEDDKDGIAFEKWLDENGREVSEKNILAAKVAEDVTYTAVFGEDKNNNGTVDEDEKVTVNYVVEGNATISKTSDILLPGDTVIFPTVTTDKGYEYSWYEGNAKITSATIATGDKTRTFIVKIARIEYKIVFDYANGKDAKFEKTYHYGDVIDIPSSPVDYTDETKKYSFEAWYVGNRPMNEADKKVDGNETFVAHYKETILPVLTATANPNSWTKDDTVNITLTANKEIRKYMYSLDGGKTWNTTSNVYSVTSKKKSVNETILFKAIDKDNLETKVVSATVKIDKDGPRFSVQKTQTEHVANIDIAISDAESGLNPKSVTYLRGEYKTVDEYIDAQTVRGETIVPPSLSVSNGKATLKAAINGTYTIYAEDMVGNPNVTVITVSGLIEDGIKNQDADKDDSTEGITVKYGATQYDSIKELQGLWRAMPNRKIQVVAQEGYEILEVKWAVGREDEVYFQNYGNSVKPVDKEFTIEGSYYTDVYSIYVRYKGPDGIEREPKITYIFSQAKRFSIFRWDWVVM